MDNKIHIVNGGWQLHQVKWSRGDTIKKILNTYVRSVQVRFANPTLVFNGYGNDPSTKDHKHMRRISGKKACEDLKVTPELKVTCDREVFLSNENNKCYLINMLSDKMDLASQYVKQMMRLTHLLIAETAINKLKSSHSLIIVVARDIHILVLLMYHRPHEWLTLYKFVLANRGGWPLQYFINKHHSQRWVSSELCMVRKWHHL